MNSIDIDPEDIAMFMGVAEEMAEEERLYDDLEQKSFRHRQEKAEGRYQRKKRVSLRSRQKSSFWRYVDDVCTGAKKPGDPLETGYDYRAQIPFPVSDNNHLPISLKGCQVFRAYLVSEKFIEFIGYVLERYPQHNVQGIVFNSRGYPRRKKRPVFAVYIRRSRMIAFNLKRHYDNAARIAYDVNPSFSIRALIWYSMTSALLHELHHSITQDLDDDSDGEDREQVEQIADQWSETELKAIAEAFDVEPPPMEDEPYFSACFNWLMQDQALKGRQEWVDHQKLLLDANVMYWDPETCIAYPTMKEFIGIVPDDRVAEERETESEAECYADIKNQEMVDYWTEDENKETAIREAIRMGYRLGIDYEDRHGRLSRNRVIRPRRIIYRNGDLFAEAFCEQRLAHRNFRISKIKTIEFLITPCKAGRY